MEKFNLILVLLACFLINQSFPQISKPEIKPYPAETKTVKKDWVLTNELTHTIENGQLIEVI